MIFEHPKYRIMGDRSLLVEAGDGIDPAVNRKVRTLFLELDRILLRGIRELVPGYRSL
ncbi:MAG: carboxyltransferase domain-containing protein, partial [Deltaproteobacteria bacterium]|nr:carboxyltransferase domain-containing protein [Deltaproteobacteria bacterium]